jgi:polyhydroxyalkanoate synthesis regulator phasin
MAHGEAESLLERLRHMSEEGLTSFLNEMMTNDAWRRGVGRAGERLLANKHTFDRNIESLLDFVSIPSKRDVRELKTRLDYLNTQIVNLSMKIDRMLAKSDQPGEVATPKPRRSRGRMKE